MNNIFERVLEIINKNLEQALTIEITPELKFTDLGVNSISIIKLITLVEVEFGIEFEDEKLNIDNFETVENFCDYINILVKKE